MPDYETRSTRCAVELRSAGSRTIGGYALKFHRQSEPLGGYVERIAPSFVNESRAAGWPGVICRYQHDDSFLLGTVAGRTLRLSTDRVGLDYSVDLPGARDDILELVSRGDVSASSFAFQIDPEGDEWSLADGGIPLRTLVSGRIVDTAPVSTPAYLDTSVGLRSLARYASAPIEDVMKLAKSDQLRKFLTRSDRSTPRPVRGLSGATAAAQIMAKKPKPLSGVAAKMQTLAKKRPEKVVV